MGEKKKKNLCTHPYFKFNSRCLFLHLSFSLHRRALLVFMVFLVCAAPNCEVLIHFPVLWIPLRTCLEERNQAWGRHTKKWQQSDTRYFSGAPGPLLVLKNRKCLSPCPEAWAGLDLWISSPTNHPHGTEERKRLKCGFSFWEAFAEGKGKGAELWFNLTSSNAPGSTSCVHRSAFLHLLLEKSQKRSLTLAGVIFRFQSTCGFLCQKPKLWCWDCACSWNCYQNSFLSSGCFQWFLFHPFSEHPKSSDPDRKSVV